MDSAGQAHRFEGLGTLAWAHAKTAALRRQHEHLIKGTHLTVGDNAGRGERHEHDLHLSSFHPTEKRPAYRLLYDLPHADQGGDREFTYDVGPSIGSATLSLEQNHTGGLT